MTLFKGGQSNQFAQVGTPGGELSNPVLSVFARAPICDEFGRLILRVDGIINISGGSAVADTTTWFGTSLNAGFTRSAADGFHNIIPIASSADVTAVTKIFGYNNGAVPGFIQIWFSNDTDPGASREIALIQPVASYGSFDINAYIPFHVFGGSLWLYMVLVFSSDPLELVPLPVDSLWASWNYISKNPYP